jgi:hypothetical protein
MAGVGRAGGLVVAIACVLSASPARAQVLDAVYRGTLVCDKLPFTKSQMREAMSVTLSDGTVRYSHVVRLHARPEAKAEQGTGSLVGTRINLDGAWEGDGRRYKASYTGVFVRRTAHLKGTQTWTDGGKEISRACSGVVKRPFKVFLPRAARKPTG